MSKDLVLHIDQEGSGKSIHIKWFHDIIGMVGFKLASELCIEIGYVRHFVTMETFMTSITDEEIWNWARAHVWEYLKLEELK